MNGDEQRMPIPAQGVPSNSGNQPPAGYPPYPGYPPMPGYSGAPWQVGTLDPAQERQQAYWSHLAALLCWGASLVIGVGAILAWVPPLVIRNGGGRRSKYVHDQSTESLNFQLTLLMTVGILCVISIPLAIVTLGIWLIVLVLLGIALMVLAIVFPIMAFNAVSRGESYRYPMTIRFVR